MNATYQKGAASKLIGIMLLVFTGGCKLAGNHLAVSVGKIARNMINNDAQDSKG
jgi:hypothetical protein